MTVQPTKPKVLQATTVPETLHSYFGPLTRHLRLLGFTVEAATSAGTWMRRADVARRLGITVHEAPLRRTISPFSDLRALGRLIRVIRTSEPDIVHSHTPKAGLLGSLAAWLTRRRGRVYTVRGLPYVTATGLTRRLLMESERMACRCVHRVICVSSSIQDRLVGDRLCAAGKSIVPGAGSAQGVDARERFDPARADLAVAADRLRRSLGIGEDARIVGFVGRLTQDKGIRELNRIWESLRSERNRHLVILGPRGEPRSGLSDEELDEPIRDERVHYVGFADEIERYYRLFDCLLFPSHREGMPNVVLESAAMQVPVVAWDTIGVRDAVVHAETGFLVPFGDLDGFIGRAGNVLDDPDLRSRLGKRARTWVLESFDPNDRFSQLSDLYFDLLRGNANPGS